MSLDKVLSKIDADLPDATERLLELLRIPSISTDPAFADHCQTAADWLVADLQSLETFVALEVFLGPRLL